MRFTITIDLTWLDPFWQWLVDEWWRFKQRTLITPTAPEMSELIIKRATIKGVWK
jgi:hypothetical protein